MVAEGPAQDASAQAEQRIARVNDQTAQPADEAGPYEQPLVSKLPGLEPGSGIHHHAREVGEAGSMVLAPLDWLHLRPQVGHPVTPCARRR